MRDRKALPVTCNPTSSKQINNKPIKQSTSVKLQDGRSLSGRGKRPKEVIETINTTNNSNEPYRPPPGKLISEKDKRKLQNQMTYGEDLPDVNSPKKHPDVIAVSNEEEADAFDMVLGEIAERREFLLDMERLGQAHKSRDIIETEISQKIREMEVIDKQRTIQLEQTMNKNQ